MFKPLAFTKTFTMAGRVPLPDHGTGIDRPDDRRKVIPEHRHYKPSAPQDLLSWSAC